MSSISQTIFWFLCAAFCGLRTIGRSDARSPGSGSINPLARKLAAATWSPGLKTSRASRVLNNQAEFHFIHDSSTQTQSVGVRLSVVSKWPVLALEDIEEDIYQIRCANSAIVLQFTSIQALNRIKIELDEAHPYILVTAHLGCNQDGHRTPYLISEPASANGTQLKYHAESLTWHNAFQSTTVDISSHYDRLDFELRNERQLRKRQSPSTTIVQSSGTPSPISFPTPPPSASSNVIKQEINLELLNHVIMPPQIPVVDQILPPLTMSCKNCTLAGSLEITRGSFTLSGNHSFIQDTNNTIQFFQHGFLELIAHDFFAHVELETQLAPSQQLKSFTASLPAIPLSPIEIPGVAVLGPLVLPRIIASITFAEQLNFSHGFNVSVPDGSSITLNMTELNKSTMSGFDQSIIHSLPFQADVPIPSLIFSLSLSPQILLGINLPGGTATGGIGAFLDLPEVSVNVTQLRNVDGKCENAHDSIIGDLPSTLEKLLGNLTNIVPSVGLSVGVIGELEVGIGGFMKSEAEAFTIASTTFTLPTACLSYDGAQKTFGPPATLTSPTAATSSGASGGDKISDARKVCPSFGVRGSGRPLALLFAFMFFSYAVF